MSDERPIVCVDLDGVLNLYDGFKGPKYYHPPRPGAAQFLEALKTEGYRVVVFTTRWADDVHAWLNEHQLSRYVDEVTDKKLPAHVFIDDRAICFRGTFEHMLEQIRNFKAHWE